MFGLSLASFKTHDGEQKIYVVSHTENEWVKYIQTIEIAKSQLKQSDIPSKYSFPLIDSLTKMQEDFRSQVIPQLTKKDSTIKKK